MSRVHANNFKTTLNGGINNSVTSIVVSSASGFPTVGSGVTANLTIQSGTTFEIVQVTATSGTTFTVVRGQEGTAAASFVSGSKVELRATADSFDRKLDASLYPAPSTSGNVLTSNGTAWTSAAPSGGGGGGSGGLIKLGTINASGLTTIDCTSLITNTYDNYLFVLAGLMGATPGIAMRVSKTNGSTWEASTGYNHVSSFINSASFTTAGNGAANGSSMELTAGQSSNSTTSPISGTVHLHKPLNAVVMAEWQICQTGDGGGYTRYTNGAGRFDDYTTPVVDAIRFYYQGSGTFSGGSVTIYGYEK